MQPSRLHRGTPVALGPQCVPKDTCHLATSPSHIWLHAGTRPEGLHLSISHPEPIHPWGTPTCRPFLSHVISGAGKPLASHSSIRDCPAMPDTLALRPSSRRLGGTWEKEKQRSHPSAGQPRPGTPFGPFFLASRAVLTPPLPSFWASRTPILDPGRQEPCGPGNGHGGLALGPHPSRAQELSTCSDIQLSKMREPLVPSSSPPKWLSWSRRRVPRGPPHPPPMESEPL